MRRIFASLLCAALLGPAQAEDVPPTSAPEATQQALDAMPRRLGYALEQPQILIRQRLFGLAHGVSLLAAACLDLPEHSRPIQDAYAAWHETQAKTIKALAHDLARHYFGPRAEEARWQDLTRALGLSESIEPSLGAVSLQDACGSLPAALTRPRYEFDKLLMEAGAPVVNTNAGSTGARPGTGNQ